MSSKKSPKAVVTLVGDEQKLSRRAAERWALEEAAAELSAQSSSVVNPHEWLAILKQLVPAELMQLQGGEVLADDVNALLDAHPRWGGSTPRLPSARQASERRAGHWDYTMDANAWWLAESISPINAAMLLSRRNPNVEKIEDAETNSSDEMEPQDFRRLKNIFEGADKEPRTLKAWTAYARQRGLKIHSWINEWEAWQLPRPRVTGVVATPELQAAPMVTAGASGGAETAKAGQEVKAPPQINSTKTPRSDSIDPVIELAQSKCNDPKNTSQVWPQMQVLAENEHPPFLASMKEGLKYHKNGRGAFFTRNALDKRLHPEKRGTPTKRR